MTELEFPPVLTKKDFTLRYAAGEFGNASPTWGTYKEFERLAWSSYLDRKTLYHLRNRVTAGETYYNKTYAEALDLWSKVENRDNWYVSAMAPTERTVIQGEVMQACYAGYDAGLYFYYSTVAKPMREALATRAEGVTGIIAVSILRQYLCPNSWEWLNVLLDRYPGHVIELSAYDCEWGTLPGFNTVVWEVRKY